MASRKRSINFSEEEVKIMIEFVWENQKLRQCRQGTLTRATMFDIVLDRLTDFDYFGAMKSEFGIHFIVTYMKGSDNFSRHAHGSYTFEFCFARQNGEQHDQLPLSKNIQTTKKMGGSCQII